jgi:serine/threonine protein kinase
VNPRTGSYLIPKMLLERGRNEVACLRFLAENTNIPIPKMICSFEDDEPVYIVLEYVEGVDLVSLSPDDQKIVYKELETHLETLHKITSSKPGGPSGIVGNKLTLQTLAKLSRFYRRFEYLEIAHVKVGIVTVNRKRLTYFAITI